MKYIFIGMILNSLVISTHDNEEACLGRLTVLKEKGIIGQCVKESSNSTFNPLVLHKPFIDCDNQRCR